jgi:hypothetical protein
VPSASRAPSAGALLRAHIERFLAGRAAPILAGLITALLVAYIWNGIDAPGAYHDERAYLVQARLLATFSWTAPSPPIPIFWEMAHLFVEPAIFAKYPPGHALVLVPGIWLGAAGTVPILLAALSGALTFVLARRLAGVWVAAGTWALWTAVPETLDWHSSYLSETTTAALWLVAVWALLAWRETQGPGKLALLVAAVGWMGITRPITAIALGAPIAIVVLHTAWTRRTMPGWKRSVVIGLAIVAIVPYWSVRTLGEISPLPYAEYSRWYFPWDMPGFERDTSPPLRTLPPDLELLAEATKRNYEGHTVAQMPTNFGVRSHRILTGALGPVAEPLWILIPVGGLLLGAAVSVFAGASFVLLVGAYLMMPHAPEWTIYYLEILPAAVFFAVAGLANAVSFAARAVRSRAWAFISPVRLSIGTAGVVALVVLLTARTIPERRWLGQVRSARQLLAATLLRDLPDQRAVVFVRRNAPMSAHFTLWDILGPPETTPLWVVRDLGPELNAQLLSHAAGRRGYVLDEREMTLSAWTPAAGATDPAR